MNLEESARTVRLVKDRYQYLKLTDAQAQLLAKIEEPLTDYSDDHVLTDEEKNFYQKAVFKEVLSPRQYRKFQVITDDAIQSNAQIMMKIDSELALELSFEDARLKFLKNELIPTIHSNSYWKNWSLLQEDAIKLDYVRNEYRFYLNRLLRKTIIHQYRFFKTFMPNQFYLELAKIERQRYWPMYERFKAAADTSTVSALEHLCTKVDFIPLPLKDFLQQQVELIHTKWKELTCIHFASSEGRNIKLTQTDDSVQENLCSLVMTVLLVKP